MNGGPALRAVGAGRDNGKVLGQAIDAYIEKAPYTASQEKNKRKSKSFNHDLPVSLSESLFQHFSPVRGDSFRNRIFLHFKPFLLNIVWDLRRCQFLTGIRLSSPPGTSASGENGFYILNLAFPGKITHLYAFPPLASWV